MRRHTTVGSRLNEKRYSGSSIGSAELVIYIHQIEIK